MYFYYYYETKIRISNLNSVFTLRFILYKIA